MVSAFPRGGATLNAWLSTTKYAFHRPEGKVSGASPCDCVGSFETPFPCRLDTAQFNGPLPCAHTVAPKEGSSQAQARQVSTHPAHWQGNCGAHACVLTHARALGGLEHRQCDLACALVVPVQLHTHAALDISGGVLHANDVGHDTKTLIEVHIPYGVGA
jgi:hypothetical protein